ncbi:MAG TPA: MBL fold metallo-hydrolase, partial [Chloroflexota bacterium]|nr:MBL fold metallo-hydrolase [Chloroflexota bacterium]
VDVSRLTETGLLPGAWLRDLKGSAPNDAEIVIDGARLSLGPLRERLLVRTPGQTVAYLTDFLLDGAGMERLSDALRGCDVLICESQYRHADLPLAERNYHMTSVQAAELVRRCGAGRLILFHLSDRYRADIWQEMLAKARAVFPNTHYPEHWQLSGLESA